MKHTYSNLNGVLCRILWLLEACLSIYGFK